MRAAYVLGSEEVFIQPSVDLGIDQTCGSNFEERHNTGTRFSVDTDNKTCVSLATAMGFVALDGVGIRPHASVALTPGPQRSQPSLKATFADAGAAGELV